MAILQRGRDKNWPLVPQGMAILNSKLSKYFAISINPWGQGLNSSCLSLDLHRAIISCIELGTIGVICNITQHYILTYVKNEYGIYCRKCDHLIIK